MTDEDFKLHDELVRELQGLDKRRRFAFMALCLERILIISQQLIHTPLHPQAIDHLWERAANSAPTRAADDLATETGDLRNEMEDKEIDDFTIPVAQAFEEAMYVSGHPTDDEAVVLVASNASDAMAFEPDYDKGTELINEETQVQLEFVRVLKATPADQLTQSDLRALRGAAAWHARFLQIFGRAPP